MINNQHSLMGNSPLERAKSDEGEGSPGVNAHDETSVISGVAPVSSNRQRSSGISAGEGSAASLLSRSRGSDPHYRRSLFRR